MGYSDFNPKNDGTGEFEKDKRRRRTVSVEPVTRTPRADYQKPEQSSYQPRENRSPMEGHSDAPTGNREGGSGWNQNQNQGGFYKRPSSYYKPKGYQPQPQGERRSYNPNFSADNKFIGGGGGGERSERSDRDFNKWEGGNNGGQGRPEGGERKPYEKRPYNPNRPYTPRPEGGEGGRPYGNYGNKPYGNKQQFGGKKKFFKKKGIPAMDAGVKPETYPAYAPEATGKEMRLNRYIAMSGKCSRREADALIANGDVTVNGAVVTELGVKVMPTDEITLNGKRLWNEKKVYILMNKPKGFVTSVDDPHAEKTVMDIVRNACAERIYPVGRLDKNSVGVLLLTNDGDLTEKLTHPSHNKKKIYQITLERALTNLDLQRARDGIDLDDGVVIPDAVDFVMPNNRKEIGIEIHSGRNRIVRRIFEELGYGVHKLDRVYFCGLTKKNIKRGQWRFLTDREVNMLKTGRYD